jgi:hypothetical protein
MRNSSIVDADGGMHLIHWLITMEAEQYSERAPRRELDAQKLGHALSVEG